MTPHQPPAVVADGVGKTFGDRPVLQGLDLRVDQGTVLGLLGSNGAGKSTLIRIMTGLLRPDAGTVRVAGLTPRRDRIGEVVGVAPQDLGLYPQLTARQNLGCFAQFAGLRRAAARRRADEVLALLGLEACADVAAGRLSGGQKRRLHTAVALAHRPTVIFLDEPTVGADVQSRAGILGVVQQLAEEGATVVYTTHYLAELEQLDARIAVLHGGRIVVDGPLREVVDRWSVPSVRLRFAGAAPPIAGWAADGEFTWPSAPVDDPGRAVATALAAPGVSTADLLDVQVERAGLESAYLAITGEERHDVVPA